MPSRKQDITNNQLYHVYNRGFLKQPIFRNNKDCQKFISRIKKYSKKFKVKVLSFALMENHIHFLLFQEIEKGIQNFMQKVQQSHALYFNVKYKRQGPLFESRFKAKLVNKEDYFLEIKSYIANNPLEKILEVRTKENSIINSSSIEESGLNQPFY